MRWVQIGDGVLPLIQAIQCKKLLKLECLDLGGNHLGNLGMLALMEAIQSQAFPDLTSLNVGWNQISSLGMLSLIKAIDEGHLKKLKSLDMEWNRICDAELVSLIEAIQNKKLSLDFLNVRYNPISNEVKDILCGLNYSHPELVVKI